VITGYGQPCPVFALKWTESLMSNSQVTISLDCMGGDFGVSIVVPAALKALSKYKHLSLILVGDEDAIKQELGDKATTYSSRLDIQHATQVVGSDEAPSLALRGKKDSSMRIAINLVKEGKAQATVSAGNTGALMATARFVLKTLPGIDRPAICSTLPNATNPTGFTHVLDLGANVDSSAESLLEFAFMGDALAEAVFDLESPTIGLLNIGEEEIKGNERVKEASRLLADSNLNYVGYVEGDGIFLGSVDVVVCDGFIGNVMLKTTEGVAKMITSFLKEEYKAGIFSKITALLSLPALKRFKKRVDPREYNGASFLGLQGIVVKSHGSADAYSFCNAIHVAMLEVEKDVPSLISQKLESQLVTRQVG